MSSEIEVLREGVVVRVIEMTGASLTLGRDLSNDVVLVDALVSGHHAVVETSAMGLVVRDLNSTNGTFVNDEAVKARAPLAHGDVLRLGTDVNLRVRHTPQEEGGFLVIRDEAAGTVHPLFKDRFVIGASLDADLRLMSGPSRAATLITHADGELWLGTDHDERLLEPGERFDVHGSSFVVEMCPEDAHAATTARPMLTSRYPYTLTVAITGASGGLAVLEGEAGRCELRSEARVSLVYMLGRQLLADRAEHLLPPLVGWCHDEDVMVGVWGRDGLTGAASKYSVLLHRVRKDIEASGLDPWCLEKRRGATRMQVKTVLLG